MTSFADPGPTSVAGPKPPPTVMRGPAHADNYRIKVGRYKDRWYRDPLPADDDREAAPEGESYPSVSIVKGASGKDWTYTSLKRIAHSGDLAELAQRSFYERYERFKVINALDLSAAMRRGTNVHTWAECNAYGVPQYLTPNDDGAVYFPIVDKLFEELQPKLVAAEFVCIHRTLNGVGYGGTSDGIFEIDGGLYMVDWKSRGEESDHDCYPEEAGQLGGYIGCQYIIVEDDDPANPHGARRDLMPELDGALIVSIKPDSYEVYPVDLDKAIDHFHAMHAWWAARRTEGQTAGAKWAPRRAVPLEQQLQESLDHVERRNALRVRHDKLTKAQQAEFRERAIDINDLDAIEQAIDDIVNPPTVLDMAKARMAKDLEREADRRLSLEGGLADPDDVALFEARWELGGISEPGKRWIGRIVMEATEAGHDFRLSALRSQRRADIYNALTEWAVRFEPDAGPFHAAVAAVGPVWPGDDSLGVVIGSLTTIEAAALRHLVTEIVEGRWSLTYLDGVPQWNPTNTSES